MRAVLDPNVLVSGLLAPHGAPADVLRAWQAGEFEAIVSPALLDELERVLAYPKLRKRIPSDHAAAFLTWLVANAEHHDDPTPSLGVTRSADPGDDYLIALARERRAAIVSGDRHLLDLAGRIPVYSPRGWLQHLELHRDGPPVD